MHSSPFPFETDYVSQMSESELLSLADELEQRGFWRLEADIKEMSDKLYEQWLTGRNVASQSVPFSLGGYMPVHHGDGSIVSTSYRTVSIRMPPYIPEAAARFLIEVQIREQMRPDYDPTDR